MKYCLDTNTCIQAINGRVPVVRVRLLGTPLPEIVICSVVRAELFYGAAKSQTPEATKAKVEAFLSPFFSLPFDDRVLLHYASLRAALERSGTPIGALDMQIAAIALTHNLILVTHNGREFGRISGLQLEDWEMP